MSGVAVGSVVRMRMPTCRVASLRVLVAVAFDEVRIERRRSAVGACRRAPGIMISMFRIIRPM